MHNGSARGRDGDSARLVTETFICTWPGYVPNQLSGERSDAAGKHINHLSIPQAMIVCRSLSLCVCVCVEVCELCKIVGRDCDPLTVPCCCPQAIKWL